MKKTKKKTEETMPEEKSRLFGVTMSREIRLIYIRQKTVMLKQKWLQVR